MGLGDSSPTNKLYVASANALVNGSSFDRPLFIALTSDDMSAWTAATTGPASESTGNGLVRASATVTSTTVTVANDACKSTVTFTCSTSGSITGHLCGSSSTKIGGEMLSYYCYAATVPLTNGDTLAATITHQYKRRS